METISIFELGVWFSSAFAGTVVLLAIFLRKELEEKNWAWIFGSLFCATWFGLLVLLAYVGSQGGAVRGTEARKVLREKDLKILELEKEKDQKISELKGEVEKKSGQKIKEVLDENSRLRTEKSKAEADLEQLRSQVASLQARLDEFRRQKIPEPSPGVKPSASPKVARPPNVSVEAPKHQEFPKLRVEVTRLNVGTGNEVEVFLTYFNKTQEELKLMLIGAAMGRTFVTDNIGNRYKYKSSSGLSADMYESYMNGAPMPLGPGTRATATFSFVASQPIGSKGALFSFISEQALVRPTVDKYLSWKTARVETQFNLTIQDIEPR